MTKKFIYLAFFSLAVVTVGSGCGKPEVQDEANVVDIGMPTANGPGTNAPNDAPPSMPSAIKMPAAGAIDSSPKSSEPPENKDSFQLPPAMPVNEPVTVNRPVLDDAPAIPKDESMVVKLTAATLQEVQSAVAKSGQVCVVDFWSLACEPCLKEFPGLVRLHQELADKVTCLSVNVDFDGRKSKPAEVYRSRAEDFLKSTGATFQNYLCLTPNEEAYSELKIVSIPAVLIYDADGKLVRTFTDAGDDIGFSYEKDIAPLVKSLLSP